MKLLPIHGEVPGEARRRGCSVVTPPHSWGGAGRSPAEGLARLNSSPFMGRCRAKPGGGAGPFELLPIHGEVRGKARRRGCSVLTPPHSWGGAGRSPAEGLARFNSSPFMGRCRAKPGGGAVP